jgi:hypothetical protein
LVSERRMFAHRADAVHIEEETVTHRKVGVEDAHASMVLIRQADRAGCRDLAWLENAQVPAGATRCPQANLDVGSIPIQVELEAWPAGLGHLEQCRAPPPRITEADVSLEGADGAEVLTEGRVAELFTELLGPRLEMLGGVRVHRLIRASVDAEVGLRIAGEVKRRYPEHGRWGDRALPDSAPDPFSSDLAQDRRRSDVDGRESDHVYPVMHVLGAGVIRLRRDAPWSRESAGSTP